jgi:hypothetical protein
LLEQPCPMEWEKLAPTELPDVRYCSVCERNVHQCDSPERFVELAKLRECVAIPAWLHIGDKTPCNCLGNPRPWHYELEVDAKKWWRVVSKLDFPAARRLFPMELNQSRMRLRTIKGDR